MSPPRRAPGPTTPQATLAAVIKTARDIMRKDAGLTSDLDRVPQLAWLLFLKAFDALEERREVVDEGHVPAIVAPYRWRDWAADPVDGRTADVLVRFVNDELLPYLRNLRGDDGVPDDARDTIAAVFSETYNRMLSGVLLRDVVNKVNEINFTSSDDIHTMAHLYETMLREVRDAAGSSGEFYTPRPVIRFMVQQVDPKLGETVLDPACGTGGFLVEAIEHVRPFVDTAEDVATVEQTIRGVEKKPLPYLLGMMNLVLHEVQNPHIIRSNALLTPITEIRRRDRVDVVLTNPPFGGEEERAIADAFPPNLRTAETAWLFLLMVEARLKDDGRCGIVVPNGVLFADGVGARIKERLLASCNLHTVVRLPPGVFAPYTAIPTNLLFFDKTGPTREVWFYELPLPEGRKNYTKTKPLRFEEFADCQTWWGGPGRAGREETRQAWRVDIARIRESGYNLDLRNPNADDDLAHRPPAELVADLIRTEEEILGLLRDMASKLSEGR